MAFWLHLVPKLNRRSDDNFAPVLHTLEANSTDSAAVHDDVTITSRVSMETASTTLPVAFRSLEDGSVRMTSRPTTTTTTSAAVTTTNLWNYAVD